MITDCVVDPRRLEPFQEATQTFGIEVDQGINLEEDEWAISCISPFAVAYSCGPDCD
jgi:hypothetical protein